MLDALSFRDIVRSDAAHKLVLRICPYGPMPKKHLSKRVSNAVL